MPAGAAVASRLTSALAHRLAGVAQGTVITLEITVVAATAAAAVAALAAAVLLDDDADAQAHQWGAHRCQGAVDRGHQGALPDPGQADGDLLDTRIQGTGRLVQLLQEGDLGGAIQHVQRIVLAIEALRRLHRAKRLDLALAPLREMDRAAWAARSRASPVMALL